MFSGTKDLENECRVSEKSGRPADAYCPVDGIQLMVKESAARYFFCTGCGCTYSSTNPEDLMSRAKGYVEGLRKKKEDRLAEVALLDKLLRTASDRGL